MSCFDGTNLSSIKKSLSKTFEISITQLNNQINLYIYDNRFRLQSGNISLQEFFEHCKNKKKFRQAPKPLFERVIFFHKTSLIDNGVFLRKKGLVDLDKLLVAPSPLSMYLKTKGIEFLIENKIPFIITNNKKQSLKDFFHGKPKLSHERIIERLTEHDAIKLEGISGFLFLNDLKSNTTYQRINNVPEFLCDLSDYISGIDNEWEKASKPVILKCEVDIGKWHPPGDHYEKSTKMKKSYEIAQEGFLYLAEKCAKDFGFNINFRSNDYFPFISHGVGIKPARIKEFIKPLNYK